LKLNEKSNGFRDEGSDTSDERSADLAKEFQRLENGRGVVGKALRKGLTRQLKSMTPAKNLQKALRKRLQTQRGTSTLFLVEFTEWQFSISNISTMKISCRLVFLANRKLEPVSERGICAQTETSADATDTYRARQPRL
jgi:hypothetical protein